MPAGNTTALLYGNTQGITVTATAGANSKIDNTQARNLSAYSAIRLRVFERENLRRPEQH